MPEDISQAYVKVSMQVHLIQDHYNDIGCECSVGRADNSEITDIEVIRDYIDNGISRDKEKICFCFSNGIQRDA